MPPDDRPADARDGAEPGADACLIASVEASDRGPGVSFDWRVRTVGGPVGQALRAAQTKAIEEVLQWWHNRTNN